MLTDEELEAIRTRPASTSTGQIVLLTAAERDALVAAVVQLRDALGRLEDLGRRALTECDSSEQGEAWWRDLNHELSSPTALDRREG